MTFEESTVKAGGDDTRYHCITDVSVEYDPGHPPIPMSEEKTFHAWSEGGESKEDVKNRVSQQIEDLKKDIDKSTTINGTEVETFCRLVVFNREY